MPAPAPACQALPNLVYRVPVPSHRQQQQHHCCMNSRLRPKTHVCKPHNPKNTGARCLTSSSTKTSSTLVLHSRKGTSLGMCSHQVHSFKRTAAHQPHMETN